MSTYPVLPAIAIQPTCTQQQVVQWAEALRRAMKGMGTDEALIISTIGPRSNQELQMIRKAFTDTPSIKRDLISDIKSECSGNLKEILVALLLERYEYDATLINGAIAGIGTNETVLSEVLCTRTPSELKQIGASYQSLYRKNMDVAILADVGGLYKTLLGLVLQDPPAKPDSQIAADVQALYNAGEGRTGADHNAFVNIIGKSSRQYNEKLYWAYANKYGKTLDLAIQSEFLTSLDAAAALKILVTPLEVFWSKRIHSAMAGAGTDDKTLIRATATQKGRGLKQVNARFLQDYHTTIGAWVLKECSGSYLKIMQAVYQNFCV